MRNVITVTLSSNGDYWQAIYKDTQGRRRKKGLGPKSELSRRQATKKCQALANDLNRNPGRADAGRVPTLGAFIDSYLASRTELKPNSKYLLGLTGRYLKTFFGDGTRLDRITRAGARDFRTAMAKGDFSEGRAMAETSVCRRCAEARAMFKRAVDDDLLLFNPFDRIKVRAPKPDKAWHYVSQEQLDKLLAACPDAGWRALIALCRLAGLRRGEALELPWSGVDWQTRRLTVYAQKTGAKRIVPIVPRLYDLLLETFETAPEGESRVCNISRFCLWRNFQVIRKRAGLDKWEDAFQVMRRNCETDWAQTFPQYAVSEWIGHDITISATHYLAVTEELYQRASAQKPASAAEAPQNAPQTAESLEGEEKAG